jgi:hypothetical protein
MVGAEFFDKLEPEPKFLTSWSRSRTKMDQLCNNDCLPVVNSSFNKRRKRCLLLSLKEGKAQRIVWLAKIRREHTLKKTCVRFC